MGRKERGGEGIQKRKERGENVLRKFGEGTRNEKKIYIYLFLKEKEESHFYLNDWQKKRANGVRGQGRRRGMTVPSLKGAG